jgi:hypothetical protein
MPDIPAIRPFDHINKTAAKPIKLPPIIANQGVNNVLSTIATNPQH